MASKMNPAKPAPAVAVRSSVVVSSTTLPVACCIPLWTGSMGDLFPIRRTGTQTKRSSKKEVVWTEGVVGVSDGILNPRPSVPQKQAQPSSSCCVVQAVSSLTRLRALTKHAQDAELDGQFPWTPEWTLPTTQNLAQKTKPQPLL